MKYINNNINIPQEKRKEINDKILYCIDNDINTITKEDIFNCYTGDGGLSGLDFKNFNNYNEFSEAKKEIEQGQFFTPHDLCKFIVESINPKESDLIADLTCGCGNFFNYLPVESNIYACEIDTKAYKIAKHLYPNINIINKDIVYYNIDKQMDIILGNPPFNLRLNVKNDEILSQLYYFIKSAEILKSGGLLAVIVPKSFLNDEFFNKSMIQKINESFNFICQIELEPKTFKQMGVDNFNTKLMFFQRKSKFLQDKNYANEFTTVESSEELYLNYIKPVLEEKENVKNKIFLENVNSKNTLEHKKFTYRVKKYLYDIKSNPKTKQYYSECLEYFNNFHTQQKPEDMDYKEWDKTKITEEKVLKKLSKVIKNQHHKEVDKISIVKTKYEIKYKAYSEKTKLQLKQMKEVKKVSINKVVLGLESINHPFEKLINKKKKQYEKQLESFRNMKSLENQYLNEFKIFDKTTGETKFLNDVQKLDLSRILKKDYSILNWGQGSGKSLAALCFIEYKQMRNSFIVSHNLGITHWEKLLTNYNKDFINIKSLKDVESIKEGQIILVDFYYLSKYHKQIKKHVKILNNKINLVVDESDELTSHTSKRTRITLSIFRRAKRKLLTTGTITRNNINEMYSQIELLYNNSINMINTCKYKYVADVSGYVPVANTGYMKPFTAYHGNGLFKACFNPHKNTVFGIEKQNQDIYNSEELKQLIDKTVITRTFDQIVGEKKYSYENIQIKQNKFEKDVYEIILKEFNSIVNQYFKSTGNSRKDAMLKLVRQIQLLVKASSIPHTFKEYQGGLEPEKFIKIKNILSGELKNEKVIIGTTFLETVNLYNKYLSNNLDRKIFIINGSVNSKKRLEIVKEFESTENGILICTQQSLKSSIDIPSCNNIIIESLQWNLPKINQFAFRCIRYTSKEHTNIKILSYSNTIEQNILSLLMKKEKLNEFIKTLDIVDDEDIFKNNGVDINILNDIIIKEKDKDGRTILNTLWSEQKIS